MARRAGRDESRLIAPPSPRSGWSAAAIKKGRGADPRPAERKIRMSDSHILDGAITSRPGPLEGPKRERTLLDKWRLCRVSWSDGRLSRHDIAVLGWILDHYNDDVGAAWPGYNRLAKLAGAHRLSVKRSVARLEALGYLFVTERGGIWDGRRKSHRYRPNFGLSASAHIVELLAPTHIGVCADASEVLAPAQPESSYNPRYKAGVVMEASAPSPSAPAGALGSAPPPGQAQMEAGRAAINAAFEELWMAWPAEKRLNRERALVAFREIVATGDVTASELVDGAKRHTNWVRANHVKTQIIAQPTTWFINEGWRKSYEVAPKRRYAAAPSTKVPAARKVRRKTPERAVEPSIGNQKYWTDGLRREFSRRVVAERERAGLSVIDLAQAIGMHPRELQPYEAGRFHKLHPSVLRRLQTSLPALEVPQRPGLTSNTQEPATPPPTDTEATPPPSSPALPTNLEGHAP